MDSWIEIERLPKTSGETGLSRRVAERAAWRAIVRRRLGLSDDAIRYNKNGAPVLRDGRGYIGVSHTRGWVAVVWSPEPCAIDIELRDRKISPAAAARMGIAPEIEYWCAWEAAYKYKSVTGSAPDPSAVSFIPHPELVAAVIW
jgi:phosphopantetheinyl transferase